MNDQQEYNKEILFRMTCCAEAILFSYLMQCVTTWVDGFTEVCLICDCYQSIYLSITLLCSLEGYISPPYLITII